MKKDITITWKGHSCFRIECDGYSIVFDPYSDNTVPGYGLVREEADQVLCSHEHGDHNFREAVTIVPSGKENPFTITTVGCPHDDDGGKKRGMNLIHVLDNGTLRIAHFGDIGCPLNEKQKETIGRLDAALVPVGGYYTMEPEGIAEMVKELQPRVVIPMHYRTESFGYPVIGTLEDYLKLVSGEILRCEGNTYTLTENSPEQTVVLTYQG